jgi:aminoglycoside/choline kinase family phosphotransferase
MNLIKHTTAICAVFLASVAFSQHNAVKYPSVELKDADTVICFTMEQGRTMAKHNEQRKKFEAVMKIQQLELQQMDSIVASQHSMIETYKLIDGAQQVIIKEVKSQVDMCDSQRMLLEKELKKQKRYKWTAIISGLTVNIFTLWITQKL